MFSMSDYYVSLDAAKNAQAQQIARFVQSLTARVLTRLHRKRDGGQGLVALVIAKAAAVRNSTPRLPAARPRQSEPGVQRYRDSSSCLSSP
jgi:hypothetical protein